jgi:hypothetical protein
MDAVALLAGLSPVMNIVTAATNALTRTWPLSTRGAPAPSPTPQDPPKFAAELARAISQFIADKDSDGNGSLNIAEFGGDPKVFAQLDSNRDGELTAQELRAFFAQSQPAVPASKWSASA